MRRTQPFTYMFIAMLCAIGATLCTPFVEAREDADSSSLRVLDEDELRTKVEGHSIILLGTRDGHNISQYFCDGRTVIGGTRVPIPGTYTISDDRLCVTNELAGAQPGCARFLVDDDGGLYRQSLEREDSTPIRVESTPVPCP
ncbi:MAG: hypothetical protein M0D54_19405 [Hyphomonadaceae bacterium JAD_PAG50586_4]|nr:MAG: hypothetical protein M0D54_19405 [Hyphomonadaceae bacterium JAD_PAG50586_4]